MLGSQFCPTVVAVAEVVVIGIGAYFDVDRLIISDPD
jgi:hypothetical protein